MRVPSYIALLTIIAASCSGENPSSPSPVPTVEVQCPQFGESSGCSAFSAVMGRDFQDVTGLATWSSGDPAIATVSNTGLVTARAIGEVAIRAFYQGGIGFVAYG